MWQYLNRRVSDWRITTGKERAREHAPLLERIESNYGVDRYVMLGLWGMESAFGDVVDNPKHMRPVIAGARRIGLGRAAPARLLGAGIAQRAHHRRARLGQRRMR